MKSLMKFLRDEDGIATLEWVAIAAGALILALGVIVFLDPALDSAAVAIATTIRSL